MSEWAHDPGDQARRGGGEAVIGQWSRRAFLQGLGLAAVGAGLGVVPLRALAQAAWQANPFVHIADTGVISIVCARSEMGQGVRSALPVLIADELGAKLDDVRVVQGDGDKRYGDQNTDGSSSVRNAFTSLRTAGAAARTLLVMAAAQRWRVPVDACLARDSVVTHTPSGRTAPFKDLVDAAAHLPVPATIVLRPQSELTHLGKSLPVYDGADIVTGKARFGADIALPGMLTAVIQRPPVVGGAPLTFDAAAAKAVAGVRHVVPLPTPAPPFKFKPLGGVAVVADNTWAALRGRAALSVTWNPGPNGTYDSDAHHTEMRAGVETPGEVMRDKGDIDTALSRCARRVEAVYHVPYQAHVSMEPPAAVARFANGRCEVWAPTQGPQGAREEVAKALGLATDNVTVHVTLLGGAFGRKAKPDFAIEAAWLAKELGVPVRVQWTREDDIRHDYYHSASVQRMDAGLDEHGNVVAWRHRTAFPPIASIFAAEARLGGVGSLQQGVLDVPLGAPHVRAENCPTAAHSRIGWLRSVCNIYHAFAVQSFIDEIAQARGTCPRQTLLDVMGPKRTVNNADLGVDEMPNYGASLHEHPIDIDRMAHVVNRVCELARWEHRKADGRALGLAAHRSFLSYVAVVMSVVHDARGRLCVDEAWLVADAGTVINTDRVVAQMEGAVIFGMSIALHGAITMRNGATQQRNFDDYKLVRIAEAPRQTHVELVPSDGPPGGVGEPGVPPVAPALANAVFALTGTRVRDLPIDRVMRV